jgi:hypothetical protein
MNWTSAAAQEKDPYDPNRGNDCKNDGTGPKCCFLRGTRISSPSGEIPVEDLQIGDDICTLDGIKKIKWIGYDKIKSSRSTGVSPIRVAQFAIDEQTPYRDVYLSPAHCLFLNEVLIPVILLMNDATITPYLPPGLETIEYYHIEFDTHEVIFAEGACVESYLGSNRETFSNCMEFEGLYGSSPPKTPYAPIAGYFGGRDEVKGLLRSVVAHVIDVRDPIQIAWDQIAARAAVGICTVRD